MRMNIVLVHGAWAERQFAQRMGGTVVEFASSHVVMVSHPEAIADLIETAVKGVSQQH
jgi:hypothetical protein